MTQLYDRDFARRRRQVVGERRRQRIAAFIIDDLLEQRVADALRDAAMHLALSYHWVDQDAGILGDDITFDFRFARLNIDIDDCHMAGVGERAGRIVGAVLDDTRFDCTLEAMGLGVRFTGKLRDAQRPVRADNARFSVFDHNVGGSGLQHVACDS